MPKYFIVSGGIASYCNTFSELFDTLRRIKRPCCVYERPTTNPSSPFANYVYLCDMEFDVAFSKE